MQTITNDDSYFRSKFIAVTHSQFMRGTLLKGKDCSGERKNTVQYCRFPESRVSVSLVLPFSACRCKNAKGACANGQHHVGTRAGRRRGAMAKT